MNYVIEPTSRTELRALSKLFRSICGFSDDEPIDPVYLLDRLPDLESFDDVRYDIVYGNKLPGNVPARCTHSANGYLIEIKFNVYMDAYEKQLGGPRMHIMHEIMHIFLDKFGIRPLSNQQIGEIPPYCKLEWAVMAIAGEVMMPYEATIGMSEKEIINKYKVSANAAKKRLSY